jgi:M6 family metalloprotease-like protein
MKQPDGTLVNLRLFGSEFYMRAEGLDGYTLVRDPKTKWICYAELSADGTRLLSSGKVYKGQTGKPATLQAFKEIPLHLDIIETARKQVIRENSLALAGGHPEHLRQPGHPHTHGTPPHTVEGIIKGLTVLVDFPDQAATLPKSEYIGFCNDLNYSNFTNKGSLRSYFKEVSGGKVDYQNEVGGFFRAPHTFAYYDSLPYAVGAQEILGLALHWLEDQGFDFSTLTMNEDGSTIMAINLMYTGVPPTWAQGMWHHKGTYTGFTSATGYTTFDYNCSPANSPLGIGVVAHENGHMIGKWPDTYKYTSDTGPDGIGAFDLMCWYGDSQNPVPPNPLFRSNASWGKVVDVTNRNGIIADTANSGTCYRYKNPNDTNEFFLFESRRKTGRSEFIPDAGLTVWQIDRLGNNQSMHHEVKLVPANNIFTNQNQACFRAIFKPEFSKTTNPNSNWYNGDQSGLRLWGISTPQNVMTYKIGSGVPAPNLKARYAKVRGDNNQNGFPEPGETVVLDWEVANRGQLTSKNLNLILASTGPNAGQAIVENISVSIDSLQVDSLKVVSFSVSILPTALVGEELTFLLTVADNNQSFYITKKIMPGVLYLMASEEDSVCTGLFFDENGTASYNNSSNLTQTFFPKVLGNKVRVAFEEFELEDQANCGYDYLRIHNGPTQTSTVLGKWCGTNSPGVIQSTHSTGALTFVFHSDEGVSPSGWKAIISCFAPVEVASTLEENRPEPFPNPAFSVVTIPACSENLTLEISDIRGVQKEVVKIDAGSEAQIHVETFPEGIYVFRFEMAGRLWFRKVLVNRR